MCQFLGSVVMQHVGGDAICKQSGMYVCLVDTVLLWEADPAPEMVDVRCAASWQATADRTATTLLAFLTKTQLQVDCCIISHSRHTVFNTTHPPASLRPLFCLDQIPHSTSPYASVVVFTPLKPMGYSPPFWDSGNCTNLLTWLLWKVKHVGTMLNAPSLIPSIR